MVIKIGARAAAPKVEKSPVAISKTYVAPAPPPRPKLLDLTGTKLEIFDVEQGTEEWFAARCGLVTASVVGKLLTASLKVAGNDTSLDLTRHLAAERITGHVEETYSSRDMLRGTLDEPYARAAYSEQHAEAKEVGFMVRDFGSFRIGYSPDGIVGEDGLIEIKSRNQKNHVKNVLANDVPSENIAQIQCGLLVSGRKWCDYVDYSGGMALWPVRVYPDPEWQAAIMAAVVNFELNATEMISDYMQATEGLPLTERIDHFEFDDVELKLS